MLPELQPLFQKSVQVRLFYPPFLERLCTVLLACRARGRSFHVYYGIRTMGASHTMRMKYLAGSGPRAAPAGYSSHNYGLGADLVLDGDLTVPGLQPDWEVDEDYKVLQEEAERAGLHCGASYNDYGHLSLLGWEGGRLGHLYKLWNASKQVDLSSRLKEVWAYVEANP